jgi:uncharacterized protein (DUF1499 family)
VTAGGNVAALHNRGVDVFQIRDCSVLHPPECCVKKWTTFVGVVAAVLLTLSAAFFAVGPDRVWGIFGNIDLGPVSFETLQRRMTPNDALACPRGLCRDYSDIESATYPVSARDLRFEFVRVIQTEPRVTLVAVDDASSTLRFVQRSAWFGFPDTIVVRFFDRPGGRSTLAMYSRSKFGRSDFGVNRIRLERWLKKLALYVKLEH